ncbi:Gfo/Idh/MocA family protein [Psychromarinibacter halotolerans]|uniref:Gfo/Idh/MocA family protein n=1 Tax=Psychromarinibacter halotolerans TaxID=1775175 RepID=A0ABV7GV02_9RHOB|nr:Gfo/Idh/MocA family oxidoreductase [Psychromarinibacter halotolerans]MDF0596227.1 Gfo/Idh/MocA family oxidoreductase [Psychromarinibacter halotolerans]
MSKLGIGIVGCGNISTAYLKLSPLFHALEVRAVADINMEAARQRGDEFGVKALSVEDLFGSDEIDVVVNLTIPEAHYAISKQALQAGKHVYSEKPFVLTLDEGEDLRAIAGAAGLRVGSAPDTFLGGAHQLARARLDEGLVGEITAGSAAVMSHGMEHWHPNPDFFFQPGAGPVLDVGPYYITNLVQLLGPVKRVASLATSATPTRTILTEGPRRGEEIPVATPTNIHALLDFASGATITFSASWDVWAHRHQPMELYGTEGSLFLPDPNFFGGTVEHAGRDGAIAPLAPWDHPFGRPNQEHPSHGPLANYRASGLADMAEAIMDGRDHRCSLDLSLHAVDVMTSILRAGETGQWVDLTTTCARPDALGPEAAAKLLKD